MKEAVEILETKEHNERKSEMLYLNLRKNKLINLIKPIMNDDSLIENENTETFTFSFNSIEEVYAFIISTSEGFTKDLESKRHISYLSSFICYIKSLDQSFLMNIVEFIFENQIFFKILESLNKVITKIIYPTPNDKKLALYVQIALEFINLLKRIILIETDGSKTFNDVLFKYNEKDKILKSLINIFKMVITQNIDSRIEREVCELLLEMNIGKINKLRTCFSELSVLILNDELILKTLFINSYDFFKEQKNKVKTLQLIVSLLQMCSKNLIKNLDCIVGLTLESLSFHENQFLNLDRKQREYITIFYNQSNEGIKLELPTIEKIYCSENLYYIVYVLFIISKTLENEIVKNLKKDNYSSITRIVSHLNNFFLNHEMISRHEIMTSNGLNINYVSDNKSIDQVRLDKIFYILEIENKTLLKAIELITNLLCCENHNINLLERFGIISFIYGMITSDLIKKSLTDNTILVKLLQIVSNLFSSGFYLVDKASILLEKIYEIYYENYIYLNENRNFSYVVIMECYYCLFNIIQSGNSDILSKIYSEERLQISTLFVNFFELGFEDFKLKKLCIDSIINILKFEENLSDTEIICNELSLSNFDGIISQQLIKMEENYLDEKDLEYYYNKLKEIQKKINISTSDF